MTAIGWREARNILCIRLDYLGDVLMMTPAIRALKNSQAGRHITLMTSSSGAAVAPFIPYIDAVIEYAAPWMKSSDPHGPETDLSTLNMLRSRCFDAAVIFTTYSQSPLPAALLCYLAGIPLRLAHCHENPYQLLTDWIRDPEPQERVRHEVRRQLDLVANACHSRCRNPTSNGCVCGWTVWASILRGGGLCCIRAPLQHRGATPRSIGRKSPVNSLRARPAHSFSRAARKKRR
jgi:hypothetical protein